MRLCALLMCLVLLVSPGSAAGEGEIDLTPVSTEPPGVPVQLAPLSLSPLEQALPFSLNCAAAMLVEQDSGQVIFEMNPDNPRPVASVTKVMTILLALEALEAGRIHLDDIVSISKSAAGMGGSQALLDVGERQRISVLLETMIVGSANDAAVAMAEAMFGSEAACVDRMNARAAKMGMANTHFVNCTGLPAEGQHTTARDVAVMSRQMFSHPDYFDFSDTWMDEVDHGDGRVTQLVNTNKLVRLYDGCDGGKTGSTKEAGYCVSATASRGGMRLIAVVLGADTGAERFELATKMLDHGFANYRRYPVARAGTKVRGTLPVTGGSKDGVELQLGGDLTLLLSRGDEQRVRLTPSLPERVNAPVAAGEAVGSVTVSLDDRKLAEIPVVATSDVEARGLSVGVRRFWETWPWLSTS